MENNNNLNDLLLNENAIKDNYKFDSDGAAYEQFDKSNSKELNLNTNKYIFLKIQH